LASRAPGVSLQIVRIGLIAPPWIPVPPPSYGGTEVVVDNLARGLAARGHDVRLFTVGESTCPVERASFFDRAVQPTGTTVAEAAHVLAGYEALADCDLIHDHTVVGPLTWARTRHGPPIVTTNHGEFNAMTRLIYKVIGERVAVVAISHSQRSGAPEVRTAAVIHHGVDMDVYGYGPGGDYFLFIGRMNPDKGVADAIRLARRAGRRIIVVSKMWEDVERQYFEHEVRPLLGPDVELLPETTLEHKVELLQHAAALLNTIKWPEPFGLVMAEALACGTPVVGFPRGAAPEIVDHGTTGYLDPDEDALLRAPIESIDRQACRAAARQRFSIERMAREHELLYERVVAGRLRVA
jgi:glycosyltransferase involved in cell wall biosynthesis